MEINHLNSTKKNDSIDTSLQSYISSLIGKEKNRAEELVLALKDDKEIQADSDLTQDDLSLQLEQENSKPAKPDKNIVSKCFCDRTDSLAAKLNELKKFNEETIEKTIIQQKASIERQEEAYKLRQEYSKKAYENYSRKEIFSEIEHYSLYLNKLEYGSKAYEYYSSLINHLTSKLASR
jgi:hypothetical protein